MTMCFSKQTQSSTARFHHNFNSMNLSYFALSLQIRNLQLKGLSTVWTLNVVSKFIYFVPSSSENLISYWSLTDSLIKVRQSRKLPSSDGPMPPYNSVTARLVNHYQLQRSRTPQEQDLPKLLSLQVFLWRKFAVLQCGRAPTCSCSTTA